MTEQNENKNSPHQAPGKKEKVPLIVIGFIVLWLIGFVVLYFSGSIQELIKKSGTGINIILSLTGSFILIVVCFLFYKILLFRRKTHTEPSAEIVMDSRVLFSIIGVVAFLVIAYGIFTNGGSFLEQIKQPDAARGLITFLVVSITVVIALILVLYPIITSDNKEMENKFSKGKEIFSLLIGVLGTILGFYFGTTSTTGEKEATLKLSNVFISEYKPKSGNSIELIAFVYGGKAPYNYFITFTPDTLNIKQNNMISPDGNIKENLKMPLVKDSVNAKFKIIVTDNDGKSVVFQEKDKPVIIKNKPKPGI